MTPTQSLLLSQKSLKGLWVGDCIGQSALKKKIKSIGDINNIEDDSLPYTDDTEQTLIVSKHIYNNDDIIPHKLLNELLDGFNKSKIQIEYGPRTRNYFNNINNSGVVEPTNSFGNGCLMRIIPTIVYLANRDENIIKKCLNSCLYTHNNEESFNSVIFLIKFIEMLLLHKEEIENYVKCHNSIIQLYLLPKILENNLSKCLKKEINKIIDNELDVDIKNVYKFIGNGQFATCFDTLPVCVWIVIRNINNYESAIKECIEIGGDIDTIAAIVGGIVSLFSDIPQEFINKCKKYEC